MASDFAADLLCCSKRTLYTRYLATGRLPYVVRSWGYGPGKQRHKAFVPRPIVQELAVALIMDHARKGPNLIRKKMAALAGLDTIASGFIPMRR